MAFSAEQRAKLWLSAAGVTADQWKLLREEYGSAIGIWEAFTKEQERMFPQVQRALLERMRHEGELEAYEKRLEKLKVSLLFEDSPGYPALLKEIEDPPYVLYCAGDFSALDRPMVAVIGTRKPSSYGKEMSRRIAEGLAQAGVCVVSGLAYGIDGCAHEGALLGKGATVAVLGSGINNPYPQAHVPLLRTIASSGGLAISEYPLDAKPMPGHFPHRNRIISGLSQALVFVEGKIKSGGMITVSAALSQGREVFAVPGQVGTSGAEGPHTILREGARLITCAGDILEDLGLVPSEAAMGAGEEGAKGQAVAGILIEGTKSPKSPKLSPPQRLIWEALRRESMDMGQLSIATGLTAEALMPELSIMEIMGQIRREPGNLFSIGR